MTAAVIAETWRARTPERLVLTMVILADLFILVLFSLRCSLRDPSWATALGRR